MSKFVDPTPTPLTDAAPDLRQRTVHPLDQRAMAARIDLEALRLACSDAGLRSAVRHIENAKEIILDLYEERRRSAGAAEAQAARVRDMTEAVQGGTTFPDLSRIGWLSALLAEDFESHINWESVEDPEAWHTAIRECRDMVRLVRAALDGDGAAAAGDLEEGMPG